MLICIQNQVESKSTTEDLTPPRYKKRSVIIVMGVILGVLLVVAAAAIALGVIFGMKGNSPDSSHIKHEAVSHSCFNP